MIRLNFCPTRSANFAYNMKKLTKSVDSCKGWGGEKIAHFFPWNNIRSKWLTILNIPSFSPLERRCILQCHYKNTHKNIIQKLEASVVIRVWQFPGLNMIHHHHNSILFLKLLIDDSQIFRRKLLLWDAITPKSLIAE